jgi:hypothetical protein
VIKKFRTGKNLLEMAKDLVQEGAAWAEDITRMTTTDHSAAEVILSMVRMAMQ